MGEGALKKAGQNASLPIPGLGALWPSGGWSMSHCEITYKK